MNEKGLDVIIERLTKYGEHKFPTKQLDEQSRGGGNAIWDNFNSLEKQVLFQNSILLQLLQYLKNESSTESKD
jgi:hypothetical protein